MCTKKGTQVPRLNDLGEMSWCVWPSLCQKTPLPLTDDGMIVLRNCLNQTRIELDNTQMITD